MRTILIVIGLCALSLAGRAQSSVLVSDMGYNSELNEFYFILDNFTEYALSIYPLKTESLDIINRDKTFRNGTYAFYRLKDKNGTVIKSSGPCWWKKGYDYFVLPRAKIPFWRRALFPLYSSNHSPPPFPPAQIATTRSNTPPTGFPALSSPA